jgi:hypothetical protein
MSAENKVPRKINIPPPFAAGLNGVQAIVLALSILVLGQLASMFSHSVVSGIISWGLMLFAIATEFILFRVANAVRRAAIKHTLLYVLEHFRRPKRFTGRASETW